MYLFPIMRQNKRWLLTIQTQMTRTTSKNNITVWFIFQMKYKEISKRCKILVVEVFLSSAPLFNLRSAKHTCQTCTNNSESTLKCDLKESTATFESTRKCVFVSSKIFYPHKERINNFPWKLRRTLYKKSCSLIDFIENLFCNFRWNAWSSLKGRLGMKMSCCNL